MNISHFRSLQKVLPQSLVFVILLIMYLGTIAPGLTWANGGSDGADLITAAATGGVAHPTGYPLYLLLARLFQFLPMGSLAFRTNLMSALAASLAAAVVTDLVIRSVPAGKTAYKWLSGMAAGFAFGLSPLVWSQAVITEVYSLQALLTVLIFHVYVIPDPASTLEQNRLDRGRGLLLGLAMGNHVTGLFIVPAALLLGSIRDQTGQDAVRFDPASLRRQLAWFGLGLALYLVLPLRALAMPSINWGNVTTPQRFWWLVSGQLYQSYYLYSGLPELWGRFQAFAAVWVRQFGLPGIALGLAGLIVFGSRPRLTLITAWTALTSTAFAVIYRSADSDIYLIPMFLCFAIWLGLGLDGLIRQLTRGYPVVGAGLVLLFMVYIAGRSMSFVSEVDASQDVRAESFGRQVLSAAPQNAILFAKGDRAVFSLWYFHFALGERPDLAVVAVDLLHFDWYLENLRSVHPSLEIQSRLPWPETIAADNPARAVCYVQYADRTDLDCPD